MADCKSYALQLKRFTNGAEAICHSSFCRFWGCGRDYGYKLLKDLDYAQCGVKRMYLIVDVAKKLEQITVAP